MTVLVITRHPGALEWLASQGVQWDCHRARLDGIQVGKADEVIGILPFSTAAEVCAKGARYFHISMNLPDELRGAEMSAAEMQACGARLREFVVESIP